MTSEEFRVINGVAEYTLVIEKSKFICSIKSVGDEDEAKSFIAQIKKKNSLANHNCYAYIADSKGLIEKFSDDGEPQGTAGRPILEVLRNGNFKKTVAVVTRYFGGIKLGTGGLARAYGGVVADCIKSSATFVMKKAVFFDVKTNYEGYNAIIKCASFGALKIIKTDFDQDLAIHAVVPENEFNGVKDRITDTTLGKAIIEVTEKGYYSF